MKINTINKEEINKFAKMADEWWNPDGKFKPLHKFNPIRIKYIKDNVISHFKKNKKKNSLKGLEFLDIGCGGGLLSEPFARLGANITGIDPSNKNIKIAKIHSKKSNLKINYICSAPENLILNKKFDVVLNMEVVEHVEDLNYFINKSGKFLKKNGLMFVATLNKTLKSYIFAIIGAEYVLRWLPIGTHEWEKFVEPPKLINIAIKNNLKIDQIDGIKYNPILDQWKISKDTSVNYISKFIKV
jgi:2-polyprenyl-6-hydroxyphenyl methylase/3-demethylubiquinone-9 3-methyltransferase